MQQSERLIVTGGAGFIGSCLIKHLNDLGYSNLVIVDQLGSDERWKNLVGKEFSEFVHKDTFFEWFKGKERDFTGIFHLGACSSTVETNADFLYENNTLFSMRLAESALSHDIRFIYASSAATYGDGKRGFSDDHSLLKEFIPLNMYGYSKHLFDLWLLKNRGLEKAVGLKYFNVFGPNEYHKGRMSSAVLKMVPEVLKTDKIRLFKSSEPEKYQDGGQVRDFLYVKDAVKMTTQFLHNKEGGIFNMGCGNTHSWNELAQAVIKALKKNSEIEYIEMPTDLLGKYQNYTCADLSKSKACNLLMPQYSLQEAVKEYVTDYLAEGKLW